MPEQSWRVRIRYREPGYELRTGVVRLYSGSCLVAGATAELARRAALEWFRAREAESGAGWYREVVDVTIERNTDSVRDNLAKPGPLAGSCQTSTVPSVDVAMNDDQEPAANVTRFPR